jgi:hypothetical protein
MGTKKLGKRIAAGIVSAVSLATCVSSNAYVSNIKADAAEYTNYAKLLQYSLYFYDANMCGTQVDENSGFSWRSDCHTSDEVVGGFHDAGDHVKFGLPAGYSASTLGLGYYEYKDVYDSLGQTSHLKQITDYFCDYFKASTVLSGTTVTKFCYQVGEGNADHNTWAAPEVQDSSSRTAYWTTNGASDIAAEYAAALAVNYINFGDEEDLKYAKALYEFSTKYNTISYDGTGGFYDSSDYKDDQAWAAGWLYLATNDTTYKTSMKNYLTTEKQWHEVYWAQCWNDVSMGVAILDGYIEDDWAYATSFLTQKCTDTSTYFSLSEWGSARLNYGMQLPALIASKYSGTDYTSWCKAQTSIILGNNSKNVCLVVGLEDNSAKYPHHRAASGYSSNEEAQNQTTYGSNGHTLTGALVGGPQGSDFSTYNDSMQDYVTNEVAIDYNAALVGAAAGLYEKYKTGSVDSSVNGVDRTTAAATTTTTSTTAASTTTTTAKPATTTTTTTTAKSASSSTLNYTEGSEVGDDGTTYKYWDIVPNGASKIYVTYKVTSSDTESSGSFGTWTGTWDQVDFKENVSNGTVTVAYDVPSNVGTTVKCSVYWPGVDNVSLVSITSESASTATTTTTAKAATTTTTTKSASTTTTTVAQGSSSLNYTEGSEVGDDGSTYKYWEITPGNASTITVTYKVTSSDTESSGSFGTWTGTWDQVDFKENVSNGTVSVTYTVPSNVGTTVKCSVYWPGVNDVQLVSITSGTGSSSVTTTTTSPSSSSSTSGGYSVDYGTKINYNDLPTDDRMIGFDWSDFGIGSDETITGVDVTLSTKSSEIGIWQGAFGTSTTDEDNGYWYMTADMKETISAKTGTISWDVPSDVASIIQTAYGGQLKIGFWYIASTSFTIENITVYTDKNPKSATATTTTASTTTTTKTTTTTSATTKTTTSTTKTTTTTKPSTSTTTTTTTAADTGLTYTGTASKYGDVNVDGAVDVADVVLLNKALVQAATLSNVQKANADCHYNSVINAVDATTILKYLVMEYSTLPIQAD